MADRTGDQIWVIIAQTKYKDLSMPSDFYLTEEAAQAVCDELNTPPPVDPNHVPSFFDRTPLVFEVQTLEDRLDYLKDEIRYEAEREASSDHNSF